MANTRPSVANVLSRLSVPMHGIVLQMLIFNYEGFSIFNSVWCGDCSIRVFY